MHPSEYPIEVRKYYPEDARILIEILYNTIHIVNARDYSLPQLEVWAPKSGLDLEAWKKKWSKMSPFVATVKDVIVGLAEFEDNGHIDCFYCHHEWIGRGVGSTLMQAIENSARELKISKIFAEVSITAKPFFIKKGFAVIKEQTVLCHGVELINFVMEKTLTII